MLLAKIIQHASHKIYPYEINLINHVAFVYRDYVYEFKFSKNFIKTKFNQEYINNYKKNNNIFACDVHIDNFSYSYINEVKKDKYSILHALAGYNAEVLLGKFFGDIFNKIFNILRGTQDKHYCNKFIITLFYRSLNKINKHEFLNSVKHFIKYRVKDYNLDLDHLNIDIIANESVPLDCLVYSREEKKLNIRQL